MLSNIIMTGYCAFCETEYVGYITTQKWCENCRKLKNLCNVYGYNKVYEICERVCIRKEEQIDNKIELEKKPNLRKSTRIVEKKAE